MAYSERQFHEEFRPERIEREIRLVSPDLLIGDRPEAFVRELVTKWGFRHRDWIFGPSRWVVMVIRDEMPENLQTGFGLHFGAVMTSASRVPTLLNNEEQLQSFYEDRLHDARFCRGEFAGFKKAS